MGIPVGPGDFLAIDVNPFMTRLLPESSAVFFNISNRYVCISLCARHILHDVTYITIQFHS